MLTIPPNAPSPANNRAVPIVQGLRKTCKCTIRVRVSRLSARYRLTIVTCRLECTHIYCFECLAKHLETTRKRFLRNQCWYRPREDYIHALRQPLSNPKVYLEAMEWIRVNPTPDYRCVFCCNPIARKPIQDFTLQTITEGFSQDREKAISGGGAHERIVGVDGLFDKYLLF